MSASHPMQRGDAMVQQTTKKRTASRKKSERKYSPAAGKFVEAEIKEMERGKLKSGRSGKTVTSRKQAIAIGLSEARKAGIKVPAEKP
jgi:hypothetical protein